MTETDFRVVPLTAEHWPALEDLFGPQGPCYGCWCNHFRMPPKLRKPLLGEGARQLFEDRVEKGPPPGVLAFAGNVAIGWLQIGPRAHVPEWNNPRRASTPLPDAPAQDERNWAASCFFVRKGFRGKGVTAGAAGWRARFRAGERRMFGRGRADGHEARRSADGLYVGPESVFQRAGFVEVAKQKPGRPLMRCVL